MWGTVDQSSLSKCRQKEKLLANSVRPTLRHWKVLKYRLLCVVLYCFEATMLQHSANIVKEWLICKKLHCKL